jgi:hypothetical protein
MYTAMCDGLRSYYARYPSRRTAAGFNAAATLSFICCVNVASLFIVSEFLLTGNLVRSSALSGNKALLLALGVAVGFLHVAFAKRTGRYTSVTPVESTQWKRYLSAYGGLSVVLFAAAMMIVVVDGSGSH